MTDSTKTPVDELEGRELDAAVAEEVMGRHVVGSTPPIEQARGGNRHLPHYSTSIEAAWEVAGVCFDGERWCLLRETEPVHPFYIFGRLQPNTEIAKQPFAALPLCDGPYAVQSPFSVFGVGATPQEAICRAALKAVRSA